MIEKHVVVSDIEVLHKVSRVESYLNILQRAIEDNSSPARSVRVIESANKYLEGIKKIIEEAREGK